MQGQVMLVLPGGGQLGSILLVGPLGELILSCIFGCFPSSELGLEIIKTANQSGPHGFDESFSQIT
jgi:hypothetical protein